MECASKAQSARMLSKRRPKRLTTSEQGSTHSKGYTGVKHVQQRLYSGHLRVFRIHGPYLRKLFFFLRMNTADLVKSGRQMVFSTKLFLFSYPFEYPAVKKNTDGSTSVMTRSV
jgi:hypothetical protein